MSFSLKLPDNAHELVKVVARVRPINANEISNGSRNIVEVDTERNEILVTKLPDKNSCPMLPSSKTEYKPFTFDAVIDNSFTQSQIYDKVFRSLVNSAMEGFNAAILAYGQTGTGKTFTIEGSLDSETNYGVMPNAFKQIFDHISTNREMQYLIGVSYFEIYQEEIRDLLDSEITKKCAIHENPNGGIYIKGLSSYLCSNFSEILALMVKGKKNRAVGSTNMNEHSSRSHAVFQVTIETSDQSDVESEHIKVGKLNLVDLAGSERVSKTGAEGQRLKEASKINLSLSTLGNVISALVDGAAFIPYRDSKLTRILQDSLGGNSRTVMVATVGPASYNFEETMNTLRYATRAKNIENKPRRNENPKDAVLRTYQDEISRLRNMLEERKMRKNNFSNASIDDESSMGRKNSRKTDSNSQSGNPPLSEQQMMEMSKLNELKEMLEPLDITFEGDIEAIREKLREKTKCLEKDTEMMKEERDKMAVALKKEIEKVEYSENECNTLQVQIEWLESKVLNSSGENLLLLKTKSQMEEIEEKAKELESHKMRQEQLMKVLAETEMTNEEAFANSNALENDYQVNLEKLGKVNRKIVQLRGVHAAMKKKHGDDVISLKSCIEEMAKELKLKKTIVDNFVPRKVRKDIDQRMRYDATSDEYFLEPAETGSNRCGPPKTDNMLQFPLFNFTRFPNLQPMENTFFTNENILLLGPNLPAWPSVKFVADIANPRVESLIKSAVKDIKNAIIINCDHKGTKFRMGKSESQSYVAIGPTILLRNVRSDKFVDFSVVPPDVTLPIGANIYPLQTPQKSLSGAQFTHQQLLAFPLIKYTIIGELSFEDLGQKDKVSSPQERAGILSPSKKKGLQVYGDIKKPRKSFSENIQTGCVISTPSSTPPRPRTSWPRTSRSSFSPSESSSPIERDVIRTIDARLRKSVDPYELEMDDEGEGMNESISVPSDEGNNEQKEYSEGERMLQRLQYFASRKAHTSEAKMTESQENLPCTIKSTEKGKGKNIYSSRIPVPETLKNDNVKINESRQRRNFELENSNPPAETRPPSRKHTSNEFSSGDSYLG